MHRPLLRTLSLGRHTPPRGPQLVGVRRTQLGHRRGTCSKSRSGPVLRRVGLARRPSPRREMSPTRRCVACSPGRSARSRARRSPRRHRLEARIPGTPKHWLSSPLSRSGKSGRGRDPEPSGNCPATRSGKTQGNSPAAPTRGCAAAVSRASRWRCRATGGLKGWIVASRPTSQAG